MQLQVLLAKLINWLFGRLIDLALDFMIHSNSKLMIHMLYIWSTVASLPDRLALNWIESAPSSLNSIFATLFAA